MRCFRLAVSVVAAVVGWASWLVACAATDFPLDPVSADSAVHDASRPDGRDDYDASPLICNSLTQRGSLVVENAVARSPPLPEAGSDAGTIEKGTYVMTAITLYSEDDSGWPPILFKQLSTLLVGESTLDSIDQGGYANGELDPPSTSTSRYELVDGRVGMTYVCPPGDGGELLVPYAVTDGGFSYFYDDGMSHVVVVDWQKR